MSLRLDDQLCFALYNASRAMTGAYAPILADLELTYPQYLVMLVLWEADGQRVSAIGDRLQLDSATLTPLLKRLEARALVARRRSSEDERVVEVFLTAAGKRMKKKAEAVPACILACAGLSIRELVALRTQLESLTAQLRAPAPPLE
jgi:MarR family transcriptional regulator, organic hydroperoxide resistance regulator